MYSKPTSGNPDPSPATRFQKGHAPLPGASPRKGLALRVRELVDVDELVDFLTRIMRGYPLESPDGSPPCYPRAVDRLAAARELSDRGWGKPPQSVELSGPAGGPIALTASPARDYSRLTDEELTQLEALLAKCEISEGAPPAALQTVDVALSLPALTG